MKQLFKFIHFILKVSTTLANLSVSVFFFRAYLVFISICETHVSCARSFASFCYASTRCCWFIRHMIYYIFVFSWVVTSSSWRNTLFYILPGCSFCLISFCWLFSIPSLSSPLSIYISFFFVFFLFLPIYIMYISFFLFFSSLFSPLLLLVFSSSCFEGYGILLYSISSHLHLYPFALGSSFVCVTSYVCLFLFARLLVCSFDRCFRAGLHLWPSHPLNDSSSMRVSRL